MFTLRRYTSADQEAVEHLHVFVIQQTGAYLGRGPWDDDVYAIEEVYLKNRGEFLIGECDGRLVAMGALKRTSPERAEIKRMRVHPEYQGRGYGQLILDELEARARALGYQTLHLDTSILQKRTASAKSAEIPINRKSAEIPINSLRLSCTKNNYRNN